MPKRFQAIAIAALCSLSLFTLPAAAVEFSFGGESGSEVRGNFDTTLTFGAAVRTEDPSCDRIGLGNGGCNTRDVRESLINGDDGNLNYKQWDFYSVQTRATHELLLDWRNFSAFARATYFYDVLQNDPESTRRTDLSGKARGQIGRGFDMLDYYIDGEFNIGERWVQARLGSQFLNWGESIFFLGIGGVQQPLDPAVLLSPASEVKDGFLPVQQISVSADLFDAGGLVSAQAYYQFEWEDTELFPVGSFNSTTDVLGSGSEGIMASVPGFPVTLDPGGGGPNPGSVIPRLADGTADDQGQYGLALRWFSEALDTEFGAYFINYHSKLPFVGSASVPQAEFASRVAGGVFVPTTSYFAEYPEDIKLYGLSFNTQVGRVAVGFETNWQDDFPVQISGFQNQSLATCITLAQLSISFDCGQRAAEFGQYAPGDRIPGYLRTERFQVNLNGTGQIVPSTPALGILNDVLGTDALDLVGEWSLIHYPDLPRHTDLALVGTSSADDGQLDGIGVPDTTSWGYQALIRANYNQAFGLPITLIPTLAFSHDVVGSTPGGSGFVEGAKAISFVVEAEYQSSLTASIDYTRNFGGGFRNSFIDRDFLAVSVSYAF